MNFQTLNNQRKLILISAAVGIISVFLPWFSAGAFGFTVHTNGFHGWGILCFLAFIVSGIVAVIGTQTETLDKNAWFTALISGAVSLLAIIITIASSRSGDFGFVSADLGIGIWMALAASVAVLIFCWMFKRPEQSLKSGFNSIKSSVSSSTFSNTASSSNSSHTNKIAELERLSKLKENGSISEEEYQQLKSKIL